MAGPSTIVDTITSKLGNVLGLNGTLPQRKTRGFNIDEFKSNLGIHGVAPTNLFLVTIIPMSPFAKQSMLDQGFEQNGRTLSFFCMATDLPGIDIATSDNIIHGTGPIERFPHSAVFGDIGLQFIGDAKGHIMSFFHNWLNSIVQFNGAAAYGNPSYYRMSYKDEYLCNIEIMVYNKDSDQILRYMLLEAFPYRLNQIRMDWNPKNDFMSIDVEFYYKSWTSDNLSYYNIETQSTGLSTIQKLIKLGTAVSTLRKPTNIADTINLVNNANIIGSNLSNFF
jgi:hypothetical protein